VSVRVSGWVWDQAGVKSGDLVVLLALADNAHDDGTGAYPSQAHLAKKARMTERQVRNCLKSLEEKGLIRRQGSTAGGVVVWAVVMDGSRVPGGKDFPPAIDDFQGGNGLPTEPSVEPSTTNLDHVGGARSGKRTSLIDAAAAEPARVEARVRARRPDPNALPDGFPGHLLSALEVVHATLTETAEQRGAPLPARAAIARAMMRRPRKPHGLVAERVEHWLLYGNGQRVQCRDVVARWRDWCDSEADYVERPAVVASMGGNVHQFGRRPTRFEEAQAGLSELHARLVAEGK
jgi:hypothetical protein